MDVTDGATAVGGGDFTVDVDSLIFLLVLVLVLLFVDSVTIGVANATVADIMKLVKNRSFFIIFIFLLPLLAAYL
jgi:hypothetical protein